MVTRTLDLGLMGGDSSTRSDRPTRTLAGVSSASVRESGRCQPAVSGKQKWCLRWALAFCYLQFGLLKFFPGMSSAEGLAQKTLAVMGSPLSPNQNLLALAGFETLLGLGFLVGIPSRFLLVPFGLHMLGTFAPLLLLPEITFVRFPWLPTLEGQYIMKNLVFLSAFAFLLDRGTSLKKSGH